jgi:hypothetical protein
MKTTIDIADPLLRQARELAARRGITLRAVVEEALREVLAAHGRSRRAFKLRDCSVGGKGLQRGVSWGDWDTLRALAYEGRGA